MRLSPLIVLRQAYPAHHAPGIEVAGELALIAVARCKEERLLQHEGPPLGFDGDGLEWNQDRLHPEKPYLELRVLSPAAPIQEEPLQLPEIEQYHLASEEFLKGNPEPVKKL